MVAWYRQVPRVDVALPCSGVTHTVRWQRGRIVAMDHDVVAERAFVALGGEMPACLDVLAGWRRACEATSGRAHRRALPEELQPTAALCRLVTAERRWADPALRPERRGFAEDLKHRFRAAAAESLQSSQPAGGVRRRIELNIRAVAPDHSVIVEGEARSDRVHLDIELPLSWLLTVEGRSLAVVSDRVVLAVLDADPAQRSLGVLTLGWDTTRPHYTVPFVAAAWVAPSAPSSASSSAAATWEIVEGRRKVQVGEGPWWSIAVH